MADSVIGGGGYGFTTGYGVGGDGGGWGDFKGTAEAAIAAAMAMYDSTIKASAYELNKQTEASRADATRQRKCSDAKALLQELIGYFPAPDKDDKADPTLNDIKDLKGKGDSYNEQTKDEKVDQLNALLGELGFPKVEKGEATKSKLESLQTKIQGLQEQLSTGAQAQQNRVGLLSSYCSAGVTGQQGMIKSLGAMAMGYARIPGSV